MNKEQMENMVNELAAKRQSHIDNIDNLTLTKIKAIVRTSSFRSSLNKDNLINHRTKMITYFHFYRIANHTYQGGKQEMSSIKKLNNTLKSLGGIPA